MTESTTQYTKGTLYQLTPSDLQTDPNQPRKYFDAAALQDLVNSIKDKGVLQPILFRVDQDGNLFVVAGERRIQAAREAGLETIPAIFVEGNYDEIALVENILREDLTAIELAESLNRIMKEHDYNQEQLTVIIGKAKSTVSEILSLNQLPAQIRDECRSDKTVPRQLLINIARKKQEKGMLTQYKKYKDKKLAKETSKNSTRKKSTFQTRLSSRFDKINSFMTDIDLEKFDPAARKNLSALVEEIKKTADALLKKIKSTPAVKAPAKEKSKPKKIKPVKKVTKTKAKKS